jgi:glycosyltransferase involved in cell wall biosynthesis
MKISIITPSFNQGEYIEQTILSVLNQSYKNFEHIICDGGSTDRTIDILKKYKHLVWVSEKDAGQSDALNKALSMCTGDIIGWINSDDYYHSDNIFEYVISKYTPTTNWIIGGTSKLINNEVVLNPYKIITKKSVFTNCDYLRSPASFYKYEMLKDVGGINKNLHQVMDYELYIKLLNKNYNPINFKKIFTVFRVHPEQKTNPNNLVQQYKEIIVINLKYKLYYSLFNKSIKLFTQYILLKLNK